MPSEVPLEIRQEWARLRQIMYEPGSVWLSTENSGDSWLTDQFVLLNVTGSYALADEKGQLADGPYKLTASSGLQPREGVPQPDLEVYFAAVADKAQWRPVQPTEWSVAEHPGKAMLWKCKDFPALLGESTWAQIKRHYPGVVVEYTFTHNMFRFSKTEHDILMGDCAEDLCPCPRVPFCFAAGIRTPDGQQEVAKAIVEVVAA
jgi:hypothetical protein